MNETNQPEAAGSRETRRELNVLWARSHQVVLGYIRSVVVDFHQAEDVLQETAAAVAEKFGDYDHSRPFVPWVLGFAKHKVLESLRASSRDRLVFDEQVVSALATSFADLDPGVSDMQLALEKCVARLRGRPKKLLEMRYLREQSANEVAAATGMTSTAVTTTLYRVRKALLECIERQMKLDAGGYATGAGR